MIPARFLKFLVAGGVAAAVNFGSRIILGHWMNYVPSIVVAYALGMVTAFLLNRLFVFTTSVNNLRTQIGWFTLVNLIAVLQTIVVSVIMTNYVLPLMGVTSHRQMIGHGVGVLVPTVSSYIGHKYLSFRHAAHVEG